MNRNRALALIAVVLVSGGISFLTTRLAATGPQKAGQDGAVSWLGEASASVLELEEDFNREADALIATLGRQQKGLADAIENPATADSEILVQLEAVIAAHEHLLKRVGEHIAKLRSELPATQRERLMDLCAQVFRGPMIRGGGRGAGYGAGNRMGRGMGGGYGRGRRLGGGLAQHLRLTAEQLVIAQEQDPGFEADSNRLRDALLAERAGLLAAFEDSRTTNDDLLRHIEKLTSAHTRLERRIATHVLTLRPHLSPDQQKWLIGLCRRGPAPDLVE
ncbi:MAG: hypothetical protein JSW66_04190 [Phycisphaerales bacterium]|nr:MAG: hypothetical protein JSW66_04190 [Phycisphaerales bacterium]